MPQLVFRIIKQELKKSKKMVNNNFVVVICCDFVELKFVVIFNFELSVLDRKEADHPIMQQVMTKVPRESMDSSSRVPYGRHGN